MITLLTTNTIQAVAGTATAVTYTIFGDEVGTTQGYKVLAQGQIAASVGAIYTVPGAPVTKALVSLIVLANATASDVTGVKLLVNGTAAANQITPAFTVLANGMAVFDGAGWKTYDGTGALQVTAPNYTGRQIRATQFLTTGTSYTTPAGCRSVYVECVGGGGGGGGAAFSSPNGGFGAGGASGAYAAKTFAVNPSTAYTYAIGGVGSAGANTGGTGGTGGDTTFAVAGVTVTAKGGLGGVGMAAAAGPRAVAGGAGVVATLGDVNDGGDPGKTGVQVAAAIGCSGQGGSSVYGGGGAGRSAQGAGIIGLGFGAGGGGAAAVSASALGATGTAGLIVLWEYF